MSTQASVVNGQAKPNGSTTPAPTPVAQMKEPFVQRDGKAVDLAAVVMALDATDKQLVYSFRDEYEKHFQTRISIPDLVSDLLSRGITAQRNSMKWGTINKETRKVEVSAKAEVADLLSSGPLTAEKKAEALDILLEAQAKAAAIKAAARKRR
jgi:hypothetical protein